MDLLTAHENWQSCFQVLQRDRIMERFQKVTYQLEQVLDEISLDEIDISDEVKEQVSHHHDHKPSQFMKACPFIDPLSCFNCGD